MAQWDGIGDTQDWGEYFAGRRAKPPKVRLDASSEKAAREWAAAMLNNDRDRAREFAAYMKQHDLGEVQL
jgi:hypothetical protein